MNSLRISGLLVCALAVSLAGCQKSGPAKTKVAFVTNNPAEFWTPAEVGARQEAEKAGLELLFKRPQDGTAATQKQVIEDLISQGVKAISVSVINPDNQIEFINKVADQIPFIAVDNDAPKTKRKCYLGTSNLLAGRSVGELIKEALPDGGKIALFVGQLDPINARERRQGLLDVLEGLPESKELRDSPDGKMYGKYELIKTYTDNVDKKKAKHNAADVLSKNQSEKNLCLIGLWQYNPPAILSAVEDAKRLKDVKIVGFDDDKATLAGIQTGDIYGTVAQQPYEFGREAVKMMAGLLKDPASVKIPEGGVIAVPHTVIKKDNVDAYIAKQRQLMGE